MSDRKRSPNWQMSEKMLLVDLVAEHFSVVENKRTDDVTMKQKNAEWVKISEEFNSQTTFGYRTAENVKAQWESLKKSTKKESSAERQSLIQTGGGPAKPKLEDNPLYRKIFALISTTVVGLVNEYDSDNMCNNHFINEEIPSNTLASTKVPDVTDIFVAAPIYSMSMPLSMDIDTSGQNDDKSQEETADWGDYTPKLLQTPKSAPLRAVSKREEDVGTSTQSKRTSKRRPALPSSSLEEYQKIKIKATEMQMNFAAEEREEARKMFEIDIKIKNEVLKQEKIKTNLLISQLRRRKQKKIKTMTIKNMVSLFNFFSQ